MADLKSLCTHLEALGQRKPNPEAREQLRQALESKWDGVRTIAAKSLCTWADEQSIVSVREALEELAAKPARYAAVAAMAREMRSTLKPADLQWAANLFLKEAHADNRFALQSLFEAFDPTSVEKELIARSTHVLGSRAKRELEGALYRARWRAKTGA
jgi:hypothetical protein